MPDQEERILSIVERSAILSTSKFVRIAVDWLLMSDISEVLKRIVDGQSFQITQSRKSAPREKSAREKSRGDNARARRRVQLFNSMDPSPFHESDLDDDAEEFIVGWAREFPPGAI